MSTGPTDSNDALQVICLCAAWCGVCREWQPAFGAWARSHAGIRFAWVDVEDEDEALGEVEIETFPTLLVARGGEPLFFGPVQPAASQLSRLLARADQAPPMDGLPGEAARGLLRRLQHVLPRVAL